MTESPRNVDAAVAAAYERDGIDLADWHEPEPVQKPPRLDVTLSVRFSADEIAAVRQRAAQAGLKPTTYIRRCALAAMRPPLERERLTRAVDAIAKELDDLRRATA